MEQGYFDRVTRQTHVRKLLQKAVLNLCQKNYAECASNLEVDGIICISFPDSPDQHVVKIHEKIQLDVRHSSVTADDVRHKSSCDRVENGTFVRRTQSGHLNFQKELNEVLGDRDRMQNSYFNEESTTSTNFGSRNPVFPKTKPVSLQNNKVNDSEGHTSKSKRKMFKVVQRKRTTPDEPEVLSDSDEMPITSSSETLNTKLNLVSCDPYREEEKTSDRNQSQNRQTTNICESVEDGYVIVKVENFDDDENIQEKTSQVSAIEKFNSKKMESDNATQPSRQWIQLPTQDNVEHLPSSTREGHITIDARVSNQPEEYDKNYFSRTDKDEQLAETDNYKSHYSVGKVDLSSGYGDQTSLHMGKHDSYEYQTNDYQMKRSPQFSSGSRSSQQPIYTDNLQNDLLRKNRLSPSKGSKTLDNLFINKCAEEIQSKLHRNKMEMSVASQQNENVSMIDLQSTTSNEISNVNIPETLSIRLNRLISTHAAKEKKYFCRHCGKGFTLKCTRSRHEKTICGGGGEGQYRCHICLKVFTRSDSRCRHLWKTHGVKSTSEVISMC